MTTRRLVSWIVILAVFAMAARISVDSDTWWHLRSGQWIVDHRAVPQVDPFSYTRQGQPWQYPGWLVEVPMWGIYQIFGPGGLNLWTALMATLAFLVLWRVLSGDVFLRAFVVILAATVSAVYWAARPYMVTFIMTAAFLLLLERHRWEKTSISQKHLWWLPILMVIWGNSHGGFAVGFILWGIYWISEILSLLVGGRLWRIIMDSWHDPKRFFSLSEWRLTLIGISMIVAVCINPSGAVMLYYPFKTVFIGALQDYIQEWQSPDFHSISVQPFIWLLLLTFLAVGVSRRRLVLTDFLLASVGTYMGLLAGRNFSLFALVMSVVLTRYAAPLLSAFTYRLGYRVPINSKPTRMTKLVNWTIIALVVVSVVAKALTIFPAEMNQTRFSETLPVKAVELIRLQSPAGRIFNSYNWGAYLLWSLPEYPVFIDGRTDLYNDEIISQWLQVVRAEQGWMTVLENWQVRLILLEPDLPVVKELADAGWEQIYRDEISVVFSR